jgi:hypothetical protein
LRDEGIAKSFQQYEKNGVLHNEFNGPADRERKAANRRTSERRKKQTREKLSAEYSVLEFELEELKSKKDASLERKRVIDARLEEIRHSPDSFHSSPLTTERESLQRELQSGIQHRKVWKSQRADIETKQRSLREGGLKGARVQGNRPETNLEDLASSSSSPSADAIAMVDVEVLQENGDLFYGVTDTSDGNFNAFAFDHPNLTLGGKANNIQAVPDTAPEPEARVTVAMVNKLPGTTELDPAAIPEPRNMIELLQRAELMAAIERLAHSLK